MAVDPDCRMNKFVVLAVGLLFPQTLPAAETAQAHLFCLSLRFHQGANQVGSTLDLSSLSPPSSPNGELAPTFSTPTHYSGFALNDVTVFETIYGTIAFDLPQGSDANHNGFADVFEVSQAVSGTTTGGYAIPGVDEGNVTAKWTRASGSKDGTCILTLVSTMGFGNLGNFTHSFELIEHAGTASYTPAATNVSGVLDLRQSGDPSMRLAGPFLFLKSATNRFNELELRPGVWTNSAGQPLSYTNDFFQRDLTLLTNYFGFVDFDDGDPNTPDEPDYLTWILSIDDPNDSNSNGIPDFSDDIGPTNARAPALSLTPGSTNLLLTISGTVGRMHEVQQSDSLTQTTWTTVWSVTLTIDPETVPLPLPTNAMSFWRVRVP